jgi:hypothetical protein
MNHYIKGLDSSTINNFFNNPDFARYIGILWKTATIYS